MTTWLTGLWNWIDTRLPVQRAWDTHMAKYYAPKNFNFWYIFGVLSLLVLVNQLLSGIWLTMFYTPSAEAAFASVEFCMRDVSSCGIIRKMHSTGASAFFIVVYLHMFRGLMYGSYKAPRELVWTFGMFIYVALMAEAFMGYVLPWGQMSYWGAQVIVNLFGAIPYVGEDLVQWIRGDYLISGATLNRFFALHVVAVPIVLLALVVLHLLALHEVGSNNPDGVEIKKNKDENGIPLDGIPFHPYYTVHDLFGITLFLMVFCSIVFFAPELGGYFLEHANFEQANNLKTPEHIAPVWYFTPFYAVLRAVTIDLPGVFTAKLNGFIAMALAIVMLFFLPWLDRSKAKSIRYKGKAPKVMLILFAANFVVLGILGLKSPTIDRTLLAQVATVFYFAFFFTMPFWTSAGEKSFFGKVFSLVFGGGILLITIQGLWGVLNPPEGSESLHVAWVFYIYAFALGALVVYLPWLTEKDSELPEPERVQKKGLGAGPVLTGLVAFILLIVIPIQAVGASGGACGTVACNDYHADTKDEKSLQRGAKYFINYCMGCHSLDYSRYERVADDLNIPHDLMMDNMIFSGEKIGSLMTISMAKDDSKKWFGAPPPDLSLVAKSRSPEWVHTFLTTFYVDDSRPTGMNNKVFENVGMPHVLMDLQGLQECVPGDKLDSHGEPLMSKDGESLIDSCASLATGETAGSLNEVEYEKAVDDLVNFLTYVSDPNVNKNKRTGVYVLLFLSVLLVLTWLLNREYWKDVH